MLKIKGERNGRRDERQGKRNVASRSPFVRSKCSKGKTETRFPPNGCKPRTAWESCGHPHELFPAPDAPAPPPPTLPAGLAVLNHHLARLLPERAFPLVNNLGYNNDERKTTKKASLLLRSLTVGRVPFLPAIRSPLGLSVRSNRKFETFHLKN